MEPGGAGLDGARGLQPRGNEEDEMRRMGTRALGPGSAVIGLATFVALLAQPAHAQKKGGCVNAGATVTVSDGYRLTDDGGGAYVNGQDNVTATIATCDGSGTFSIDTRRGVNFSSLTRWMLLPLSDHDGATVFWMIVYGMADSLIPACADNEWARRLTRIYYIEPTNTGSAGYITFRGESCTPGTFLCQSSSVRVCASSSTSWTVESEAPHEALRLKYSKGYKPVLDEQGNIVPEVAPFRIEVTKQ